MKKYELRAFVNFDNCFESQFPVGGEVGALNRVYGHLKGMCASGDDVLLGVSLVEGGHRRSMGAVGIVLICRGIYFTLYVYMCKPSLSSSIQVEYNAASLYLYYDANM